MPDPIDILKALSAAAITAAVVFLVCAWPGRTPHPARASLGGALGVGLGCFVGCWLLELRPHSPPREDLDRLFLLLFPAVLVDELGATLLRRTPWLAWLLRAVIAANAARILLHDTTYLTELAGTGTREWTPTQTMAILTVLGLALVGVWALLALLAARPLAVAVSPTATEDRGRSVLLTVTLPCAGAAVVVLLSGYAGGGLLGLALARGWHVAKWAGPGGHFCAFGHVVGEAEDQGVKAVMSLWRGDVAKCHWGTQGGVDAAPSAE